MRVIYIHATVPANIPTVVLHSLSNITSSTVNYDAEVTNDGGGTIIQRGIEVNDKNDFTGFFMSDYSRAGTGSGYWSGYFSPLEAGKVYYARAFAVNHVGVGYSSVIQLTTPVAPTIPEVVLNSITGVTQTSALYDATVNNEGGATVTSRGVNFYDNPQCSGGSVGSSNGSGTGNYTGPISILTQNTNYYARAFATNSYGTAVSNVIAFKTASAATVPVVNGITATPTGTITSWNASSELVGNGGSAVSVSGIVACPASMGTPTVDNYTHKTTNGPITPGAIAALLTGLTPSTSYNVRGYATNGVGNGYSATGTFMVEANDGYELILEFQTNCAPGKEFLPRIYGGGLAKWDLGDGNIVYAFSVSHTYANTGIKTVKLFKKGVTSISAVSFGGIDIIGQLNLSNPIFSTAYDWFLANNPGMTGVTLPSVISAQISYFLLGWNSSIAGVLDLSAITKLADGASIDVNYTQITSLIFAPLVSGTLQYFFCGGILISSLDLRAFTFAQRLRLSVVDCPNISSILLNANSTVVFDSTNNFNNCPQLKYIPFTLLSNCLNVNDAKIAISNNGLTAAQLNRMLVELDSITAAGYSGRKIWMLGNNAAADSSSGGYNGTAALASLLTKGIYNT